VTEPGKKNTSFKSSENHNPLGPELNNNNKSNKLKTDTTIPNNKPGIKIRDKLKKERVYLYTLQYQDTEM
jgi:hypothetical protein